MVVMIIIKLLQIMRMQFHPRVLAGKPKVYAACLGNHCNHVQKKIVIGFISLDDDVFNEDWIIYRMVRSHRLLSLVLVAIGVGRWIPNEKCNEVEQLGGNGIDL
jgi:hypothetical protein